MNISVLIPAYNAERTIKLTLDSVLGQTLQPMEVLVMDDGSADSTVEIVRSYGRQVQLFSQANAGAAAARNELCSRAKGELIAFLDADDIWHPRYLESQCRHAASFPESAAFFVGHIDLPGYGPCDWDRLEIDNRCKCEVLEPLSFFSRYTRHTGTFGSPSFCCVPSKVLKEIGDKPFCARGAEDSYFFYLLALQGSVLWCPQPLVAYRVTDSSIAASRLRSYEALVRVFEALEDRYRLAKMTRLRNAYWGARAAAKRTYAKHLVSASRVKEARTLLLHSLEDTISPVSLLKSIAWLIATLLPKPVQPKWPAIERRIPSQKI